MHLRKYNQQIPLAAVTVVPRKDKEEEESEAVDEGKGCNALCRYSL